VTIAILYICTGRYNQFFEGFYRSAEKHLLPEAQKTYFVWTDGNSFAERIPNVRVYHKECEGFPVDSLFRFEMFLQAEEELRKFDYIFFFNSNAEIRRPIGSEILPDDTGLAMGIWPKREKQHPLLFPYERNKKSLAYIAPYGKDYHYFMGGLNGGSSKQYLEMIRQLAQNIQTDYSNGIIAKFHDESHINAYLRTHPCKILGKEFCWPEEWEAKGFIPKSVFRNKVRIDSYFRKVDNGSIVATIRKGCSVIIDAIRWYTYL